MKTNYICVRTYVDNTYITNEYLVNRGVHLALVHTHLPQSIICTVTVRCTGVLHSAAIDVHTVAMRRSSLLHVCSHRCVDLV